jgi:drug/metabolite transporter (DMT)-like permease
VLGYAGSRSLASLALGLLPAGVTALMSNSRPLIVVMAGLLVFHLRVGRPEVAATLVGFSVVALLSAGDIQATGDLGSIVLGSGLALGSAACWAASTAIARRLGGADPLVRLRLRAASAQRSSAWSRCPARTGVGWHTRLRQSSRPPTLRTDRTGA